MPGRRAGEEKRHAGTGAPWGLVGLAATAIVVASGLHLLRQLEVRVERTQFCYAVRAPYVHLTRNTPANSQWLMRPPGRGGWILDWQVRRK